MKWGWGVRVSSLPFLHWRGFHFKWGIRRAPSFLLFLSLPLSEFWSLQESFIYCLFSRSSVTALHLWSPIWTCPYQSSAHMCLEPECGEAGSSPPPAVSHSDSSWGTSIFKERLDAFLIISWVFVAKQKQPLRPLSSPHFACWDVLVKLILRSINSRYYWGQGRGKNKQTKKKLKGPYASRMYSCLVLNSDYSNHFISPHSVCLRPLSMPFGHGVPMSPEISAPLPLVFMPFLPLFPIPPS